MKKDAPCCSSALGTPIPDNECKQNTSKGCIPYAPALSAWGWRFRADEAEIYVLLYPYVFTMRHLPLIMISKNITRSFRFANRIFPILSKIGEIHPSVFLRSGIGVPGTDSSLFFCWNFQCILSRYKTYYWLCFSHLDSSSSS